MKQELADIKISELKETRETMVKYYNGLLITSCDLSQEKRYTLQQRVIIEIAAVKHWLDITKS